MKTLDQVEPRIAINATNTPGDATSLFIISQPGSYYLTGNVTGVSAKDGIRITANGVTLDLNGFEMLGVAGSLTAVNAPIVGQVDIAVFNGSVRNWGQAGVTMLNVRNCRIEAILANGNLSYGIYGGSNATIINCNATNNAGVYGIGAGAGSTVTNCTVFSNTGSSVGAAGIATGSFSRISGCSSYSNQGQGYSTKGSCTLTDCTASGNANDGIAPGGNSTVVNCTSTSNTGDGISTSNSLISNCTSISNTGAGINVGNGCNLQACVANNNSAGGHQRQAANAS